MSLLSELASGTISTTDAAVITVPSGQLWKVQYITFQQPSGGLAKTVLVGRGTTATAANVKANRVIAAGSYSEVALMPFTLAAAQTLNLSASVDNNIMTYSIQGTKDLVS